MGLKRSRFIFTVMRGREKLLENIKMAKMLHGGMKEVVISRCVSSEVKEGSGVKWIVIWNSMHNLCSRWDASFAKKGRRRLEEEGGI